MLSDIYSNIFGIYRWSCTKLTWRSRRFMDIWNDRFYKLTVRCYKQAIAQNLKI
jgi:hypothetical protein